MSCRLLIFAGRLSVVIFAVGALAPFARAVDSEAVKNLLRAAPVEYSTAPLWVWSDELTPEMVVRSLRELAGQHVKQAFVHPRPGLITPYLSERWFELWRVTLQEAERLGMKIWIYDENSYPSGFAGGFVPDAMPDSRALGLAVERLKEAPAQRGDLIGAYRVAGDQIERLQPGQPPAAPSAGEVEYLAFKVQPAGTTPWLAGKFYVDLMRPEVTRKFMEVTHEAYARELGGHFGKLIPGIFTDEPNLASGAGLPWSNILVEAFRKRWGYDLLDHLPALVTRAGPWRQVRHDYWRLLLELFIDGWARPQHDWCERRHLEWTGHYWEHEWPRARGVPDNMAMYAWHQRPAIDILFNQYDEGVNAQFGNTRAVKELSSVANQLGRRRTLCETYGAGGWDLRFEDMKRIADWLLVLGVNTIDEHIADISIRGARKHDHPQSFSYHEPWWPDYHVMATYLTRLSAVMSQGEQVNDILVLEPTSTAWMYNDAGGGDGGLMPIGHAFQSLVHALEMNQVEFDLGCEDIIGRHGSVRGESFVVGQRGYHTVIIPPLMENLEPRVAELIAAFVANGGRVYGAGDVPGFVDGRASEALRGPAGSRNWHKADTAELPGLLARQSKAQVRVQRTAGDKGILFHHRRLLDDGQILLLVNTSITAPSSGRVSATGGGIEQWDLHTGQAAPYPFERSADGIEAGFELPACGSLLLFVSKDRRIEPAGPVVEQVTALSGEAPVVHRLDPNVLTLDYVDVAAGGETKAGLNVIKAASFVFQKHGLRGNPWDRAVQFKDELIRKKFPADSGFKATYRFTIRGAVPAGLSFVAERADLYAITCNGRPVSPEPGQWWLDRSFGRIDISGAAKEGETQVTLEASPLTIYHELDNAYVLGDFGIEAGERGFVIVPAGPLRLGAWNEQGMPLYGGAVRYAQVFDAGEEGGRYRVRLGRWYGSVARVAVNGEAAGHLVSAPWECDVTAKIRPGKNTIEVTVVGTLKNTLGPHHNNPPLGIAGPGSWDAAPAEGPPAGAQYATVAYGLWEPAILERVETAAAR